MFRPDEAEGPIDALADADAGSCGHWEFGASAPLTDGERTSIKTEAVLSASDGEGLRQLTGSVRETLGRPMPLTPFLHEREPGERLQRANQHASGCSDNIRYDIETFMHAVDQVNVRSAGGPEDNFGAWSHTAG